MAPTRPALPADAACGIGAGAARSRSATLATTGGSEARVRLGSGVPEAGESNDGADSTGGAVLTEEVGAGVEVPALAESTIRFCPGKASRALPRGIAAGGASAVLAAARSKPEEMRSPWFGLRPNRAADVPSRAESSRVRLRPGSPGVDGCDFSAGGGATAGGDAVEAFGAAIFRSTGRRGGWGGRPES